VSVLLITGRPGSGKTTALRLAAVQLRSRRLAGFYTEEIREDGQRRGFRAVTLAGEARDMARVEFHGRARVGRYVVDLGVVDWLATTLSSSAPVDLWVIDEIGRMECLSRLFTDRMRALLNGPAPVVATVAQRGGGFIAEVKRRSDAELRTVSPATRDAMPGEIVAWATAALRRGR
jgi:nucleoside-triphosphatase